MLHKALSKYLTECTNLGTLAAAAEQCSCNDNIVETQIILSTLLRLLLDKYPTQHGFIIETMITLCGVSSALDRESSIGLAIRAASLTAVRAYQIAMREVWKPKKRY